MPGEAHTPVDPDHNDRHCAHLTMYVDAGALTAVAREIAGHEAGFFDLSHFTRHFKRHVGVTPGVYSKNVQSENPRASYGRWHDHPPHRPGLAGHRHDVRVRPRHCRVRPGRPATLTDG